MRATLMPDGITVFDEPIDGIHRRTGEKVIIEGFYFYGGSKCYLFRFADRLMEQEYHDTNGILSHAIDLFAHIRVR